MKLNWNEIMKKKLYGKLKKSLFQNKMYYLLWIQSYSQETTIIYA